MGVGVIRKVLGQFVRSELSTLSDFEESLFTLTVPR